MLDRDADFVDVAVPLPIFKHFTYWLPEATAREAVPGCRATVPFGNRELTGLILRRHRQRPEGEVKAVMSVLDGTPLLSSELMVLGNWISRYYFAPPGETFRMMLPPGLLSRKEVKAGSPRSQWPTKRLQCIVGLLEPGAALSARQLAVVEALGGRRFPVPLHSFVRETGFSVALVRSLARKGALQLDLAEVLRSPWAEQPGEAPAVGSLTPTADQARVLEKIKAYLDAGGFHSILVHGVTGSGKTEVYLNAIEEALRLGRSALVMVPEIGLTPQISQWFRARFGDLVAILHSGLSDGERFDQWRQIRDGRCRVVVGTRSAVFAPLSRLGIIVVDEEHDTSYKQEEMPRYHGRDAALRRGQIEGASVILGSATPQLEVYHQSLEQGRLDFEALPSRVLERPLPTVRIVDMTTEFQMHGKEVLFSEILKEAIQNCLHRSRQVLVLLNRRGYSPAVLCRSCGQVETCENCSISLTYHRELDRLICHYCGYARSVPGSCAACGKAYMFYLGVGTEKVEEAAKQLFPDAAVDRLDRDTTRRKGSFERILGKFGRGKTDILVGTQMVAKGHDFPNVTLVGVLGGDQGLRLADFRAAERTFQLLTQVSGRAGRGDVPGEVIIQTYFPNHYSLRYACAQDFRSFYEKEIRYRREFRYPPFTALAHLLVTGRSETEARALSVKVAELLARFRSVLSESRRMRILGPAPAPILRLKRDFRFQILIKTISRKELHQVLSSTVAALEVNELKKLTVDIDPVSLL